MGRFVFGPHGPSPKTGQVVQNGPNQQTHPPGTRGCRTAAARSRERIAANRQIFGAFSITSPSAPTLPDASACDRKRARAAPWRAKSVPWSSRPARPLSPPRSQWARRAGVDSARPIRAPFTKSTPHGYRCRIRPVSGRLLSLFLNGPGTPDEPHPRPIAIATAIPGQIRRALGVRRGPQNRREITLSSSS